MYIIVTSGSTCERVTEYDECEEAASQLGFSETTIFEESTSNYPPYCYLYFEDSPSFNDNGNSEAVCSPDNACICKKGGVAIM